MPLPFSGHQSLSGVPTMMLSALPSANSTFSMLRRRSVPSSAVLDRMGDDDLPVRRGGEGVLAAGALELGGVDVGPDPSPSVVISRTICSWPGLILPANIVGWPASVMLL